MVPQGTTLKDFAGRIHTELSETFLYGINARTGMRLAESYILKDGEVVSITSTAQRR